MSITLQHNEALEVNLIEYAGQVSLAELKALAAYGARHPQFLRCDALNVVAPGADFSSIDLHDLDLLYLRYRRLFARLDFQLYRRAVWLCFSPAAERHVAYWLSERDLREGMSSTVRKFSTYAEAGDWLLLNEAEIAMLERAEGFAETTRFELPPLAFARQA